MNSPGGYLYLLHGDEPFGRDEALASLKERMRALPAGEHNLTELTGPEATVANLRAAADAAPFLAERRMVVVRGLLSRLQGRGPRKAAGGARKTGGRARKAEDGDRAGGGEPQGSGERQALLDYLPLVPPTTSVVFVEDGMVRDDDFVQHAPRGRGVVRAFARPDADGLPAWVRARARALGLDVDESAVRELAWLGGDDLRRLDAELRKVGTYAAGRPITRADVRDLVVSRDQTVWTLLDALAERRADRAVRALRTLLAQGESPEALLLRDVAPLYRRLLAARELGRADRRERDAIDPAALGLNPRTLPRQLEQAQRFEPAELERALDLLLALDRKMKAGEAEPETGLELAVVHLASRLGTDTGA